MKLPLHLVLLDGIGAILLGLGLAKMLAGIDIIPAGWLLDTQGWTLIVIGVALMLPMLVHVMVTIRHRAEQTLHH
jgi:hypothetical protein